MTLGFNKIRYPDGQISVRLDTNATYSNLIKERINSYEDLFTIRAIADAIGNVANTMDFTLFIPCMFGQRSDRRFDRFQSFDLKLICDIINECKFGRVHILDPHSDVCLALIDRSEKISSFEYVKRVVDYGSLEGGIYHCLVSPDAGAYKKVFEYGEELKWPVVAANKHRDLHGEVDLVFMGDVKGKGCLIVDDYCDGGRTFVALAKKLKEQGAEKVYLYITHGLFSAGFNDLIGWVDHIYCTNSIRDIETFENWETGSIDLKSYITQFNVI